MGDFKNQLSAWSTLSYDQLNRPIYTTSSGRHRNYASFIEGIEFPAYVIPES